MNSNSSSGKNRAPLAPQRAVGRQRVAELLDAASDIIAERGYEATTMAEIAARAGAKIGSLYRFFPNKDAVAGALLDQHLAILTEAYAALEQRAAGRSPDELADMLIEFLVSIYPQVKSLPALMDMREDVADFRRRLHAHALAGVSGALRVCAPHLDKKNSEDISAVLVNNMKVLLGMTRRTVISTPGAPEELRLMNRLYLSSRLKTHGAL
ncbi:transcriptional regulator [Acetobacter nitrogenifigens DSM 23921 = NBRC 105050]|uniref:HTH tetR-type domain-containing protein n=1 Tax=Acetobacter nitrogenifigens DSM 23921 = NBRC 105050 TaxID=1120919 RepID=A0A511XBW7_9PROT|nr:TetR/AcrR family transcriptional regulator [Acetobacter nitrogenifigens]GBQ88632.1 transcriptional regulator [Acetobacter nitrogenifigens DSM 23921 = NBRC 105050]GEN60454.1 hypothetical protein ANI02nite_23380 [Acetobacter nitrogenifigens DSM 23921 = NBRC 105050]